MIRFDAMAKWNRRAMKTGFLTGLLWLTVIGGQATGGQTNSASSSNLRVNLLGLPGGLELHWPALGEGWAYTVEWSPGLSKPNWSPAEGSIWPTKTLSWKLPALTEPSQFYRLKAQPDLNVTDWPSYRGLCLDGTSGETGWLAGLPGTEPKEIWSAAVDAGCSSVTVAQGRVYTMGNTNGEDSVVCLDAATGSTIWKYSYPCPTEHPVYVGPLATPTFKNNAVYTLSRIGQAHCFEAASGKLIWTLDLMNELGVRKPGYSFAASPLVIDQRVVINGGTESGVALDALTGKVNWRSADGPNAYSTPVPVQVGLLQCLAIFTEKWPAVVNVEDGRQLWRYPWNSITVATPIVVSNRIFISSGYGAGAALLRADREDPAVVWKNKNMGNHYSSSVLWEGYLYGFDGNLDTRFVNLRCLDFETGEVKWTHDGLGMGALTAAEDKLIILTESGDLILAEASPTSYRELGRARVLSEKCVNDPVLSGGRIYCRNIPGDLVCLTWGK